MPTSYANAQGYGLGAQAVAYAARYLGVPYVWGGTTPAGFDCSGLAQYVYNKLGIKLPRTTFDQYHAGVDVTRDQLQPGDLLFFNSGPGTSRTNPGHVSIYAGSGQEIVASQTGTPVMKRPVSWGAFVGARRVTGAPVTSTGSGTDPLPGSTGSTGSTTPAGFHVPFTPWDLPTPGDVTSGIEGAANTIGRMLTRVAIISPFVIAGGALIVIGFWRGVTTDKG